MRKDRFLEQFAEHLPALRRVARQASLDYDEANDLLSKCMDRIVNAKIYLRIKPDRLKSFLHTRIRFDIQHFKHAGMRRVTNCARLPDPELTHTADSKVTVSNVATLEELVETECPFCFKANLNEYGACAMCHTIVPSHRRFQKQAVVLTEESLAVEFDFNTKIDVENAINRLAPLEQKVVRAVGLGNESLEDFAYDNFLSKSSLIRVWVVAKAKLQDSLREYAPSRLSKRGPNAFLKVIQSIEKQREN